ncbi:MAG TPA: ABC transporter ATP-binding protein [candidate division Zixibacteria bacterium]|nr:ABC transporter ATP-binding protein [candidate division Zixibacteria bacterium]
MENVLLEVKGLKTYLRTSLGLVRAVDGVDLCISKGEAVGLVGESGCGKTMTAHSLLKLVPSPPGFIEEGEIRFRGRDLLRLDEREMREVRGREISMVFQDPMTYLNPVMKVGRQIAEAIAAPAPEQSVLKLLESVGIADPPKVAQQYPHELSGGMRQRVLIAIAVANAPSLLIADEPTTALDVTVQAQILDLVKTIKAEKGTSLLLITHDLGIVAEICDRIYVMYAGKIVESGDVFSIFEEPLHPYTQGLLRSSLSIAEFREKLETIEGAVPNLLDPPAGCRFHPRCPAAMSVCREKEPSPVQEKPGRQVSCWLYEKERRHGTHP